MATADTEAQTRRTQQYDLQAEGWDGLSTFAEVARQMGLSLEAPERVEVSTLSPTDSVLVLGPVDSFPATALTEFLRGGGRMAVVDDSGASAAFLSLFSVETAQLEDRADLINGNPALAIAEPRVAHELTEGIQRLAANHPAVFRHSSLVPLFAFYGSSGLVISGAIESGRLVAVADPGVFINNMLELADNRNFSENFLEYLNTRETSDGAPYAASGRIIIVTPSTQLVGVGGTTFAAAIEGLREHPRTQTATRLLTLAALVFSGLVLGLWLRLRGPRTPPAPVGGGGVGRWRQEKGAAVARFAIAALRFDLQQLLNAPFVSDELRSSVRAVLKALEALETSAPRHLEKGLANVVEKVEAIEASSAVQGHR